MENKNIKQEIIDFIKDLVIIVIIVLFIRTFLVEPFQISGQSMSPSYYDKEFIIIDRFSYLDIPGIKTWVIDRWDVVVFKPWVDEDKEYFIKRVIGIAWDEIKIEDWFVFLKKAWELEFSKLDESAYLSDKNNWNTDTRWWHTEFKVPDGKYFLIWDNRTGSSDSRYCFAYSCSVSSRDAYVSKWDITWKLWIDFWYFNFRNFSFVHPWSPYLPNPKGIDTSPKWFWSHSTHDY